LAVGVAVMVSACGAGSTNFAVTHPPTGAPVVFVALGGDEAAGPAVNDPPGQAWDQLFYKQALSAKSTLYDMSSAAGTYVGDLDSGEISQVLRLHPGLVTVWVGLDDLLAGTPASTFESDLAQALGQLAAAKVQVLVADVLPIDLFAGYGSCRAQAIGCGLPVTYLPPAAELGVEIDAYDSAIAAAAAGAHDKLVNLDSAFTTDMKTNPLGGTGQGALVDRTDIGLTPAGEQLVAKLFEQAYSAR
jgi:hypothetical protein